MQTVEIWYCLVLRLSRAIAPDCQRHSHFILATNLLDAERYHAERLLQELQRPAVCRTGLLLPQRPSLFRQQCLCQEAATRRSARPRHGFDALGVPLGRRQLKTQLSRLKGTVLD